MKISLHLFFITLIAMIPCLGEQQKISLAKDGFPTGNTTPEGAACDLVRAFIHLDSENFRATCLPKKGSDTPIAKKYNDFIDMVVKENQKEKDSGKPHPKSPKKIGKVFSARYLSKNGPGSYGFAVYDYQEVMFVDVGAFLHDGSRFMNRTMVVKTKEGKWYVHPCPTIDSMLSAGLNDEPESEEDFRVKYEIEVEQDGADQPATAPESKSEDNQKPKPESEVRPQ